MSRKTLSCAIGCLALVGALAAGNVGGACRIGRAATREACYGTLISNRQAQGGIAAAVGALDSLSVASDFVADHAHVFAHGIGIEGFARDSDVVAAFLACGDGSASGCRHGFMQGYLESRHHISAPELQAMCRPLADPRFSSALLFQCLHGLGHGLTMFRGHDAPAALADCDLLSQPWDQTSCYGGVFMEVFVNATAPHHPASALSSHSQHAASSFRAVDPSDPQYPCSIMAQRYLYACYQIQTSVMLHLNHGDIGKTARDCDRAPADMRVSCYESLGRDVTAYASRDPRKTFRLCSKGTQPNRAACFSGAARTLVNWTATTDGAFALCRIVMDELGVEAAPCYSALGNAIAAAFGDPGEREEQCLRAQVPRAVAECRKGAGLR